MKKKILCLLAPIVLITACTTSFGIGTGIGLGSSVSVGASAETQLKKSDKKVIKNKTKEKTAVTNKIAPKKVIEQNEVTNDINKIDTTIKRLKQERRE